MATGSHPIVPPIPGIDSPRCVDSTGLLAQTEVPPRLVILGGGVIGCEFASIFSRFGSQVTIVELLERLLPMEDEDVSNELAKSFRRRGIELQLGKSCNKVEETDGALRVQLATGEAIEADLMLVSVGRAPNVEGIGLEAAGVSFDPKRGIQTDEKRRTNVATSTPPETWRGTGNSPTRPSTRARSRPRTRPGTTQSIGERTVPRPIYSEPEIAAVGLTEPRRESVTATRS